MTARERMKTRMQELGIEPKKALGQNFLINDSVINKIIGAAGKTQALRLIEIGPGLGALTDELKKICQDFVLIEFDQNIAAYWRQQDMNVIEADALRVDWTKIITNNKCILVSNLPYQISSSLVIDRSLDEVPLQQMILMFQKEVAQRIRATPADDSYGFLSVISQTFWKIDFLQEAGPGDFWPPPKIASRVLIFQQQPSPVMDKKKYLQFIKACYSQPRKLLIKNLQSEMSLPREALLQALTALKINEKARAEELSLTQFLDLYKTMGYK